MSKHNAYLKDENLLTLFSLNNLIVPEIQREYVWGNNPDVLEKFLSELKMKAAPCENCHHVHTKKNINVGFLYSYKPSYIKYESERILDELLIDGQQRITTLFLLLLYRATIEWRVEDFISIFRAYDNDVEMGFNYKVRGLTQHFLEQLIRHVKKEGYRAFDFIADLANSPYWFLDDYRNDPTVMSMISALKSIRKIFDEPSNERNYYFDFLLTNIHFWHFKTEATSQGEELYITMNSRGEQLSDNEMQKSRALPNSDLVRYGREWESWQTFFWRNRKRGNACNANADKGLNNFLACIEGLECFNDCSHKLSIDAIQIGMKGLMYICDPKFKERLSTIYDGLYIGWFDSFINCLWNEINTYDGRWDIIDPRGGDQALRNDYKNKSITRNKSMLFWSWMTYFKMCGDSIDDVLLIRILHFYYIRYQCYKRSSTSIDAIIKAFIETKGQIYTLALALSDDEEEDNISSRIFSDEEILLSKLYYSDEIKTREIESCIWEIQELPYFLDGKGVGGNTVYELFRDNEIIDKNNALKSICTFKSRIISLLGRDEGKTSHIEIKKILLFYVFDNKPYWSQQSPWYYSNYETSTWKRIVRSQHFRSFYKEFYASEIDCEAFLEKKRKEFFEQEENKVIVRNGNQWSHRKLVILYDLLSENGGIWDSVHENVALWTAPESKDEVFVGQDTVWKAARYYDSKAQVCLSADWQETLKNRYNVQIADSANEIL